MPSTLDQITCAAIEALLGETAMLVANDASIPVQLAAVTRLGRHRPEGRESFSLLLRAPADTRLPQSIYALQHPQLGTLEVFLVPLGPDAQGFRLEAVFNFL